MSATLKARVTKARPLPKASFRWRFPDRTLHVVDIENLAGAAIPSLDLVSEVQIRYLACLGFGADDQVVLASQPPRPAERRARLAARQVPGALGQGRGRP